MKIWESSLSKTDPNYTKEITGKSYKGTSPKPYYVVKKLTEYFGPCGIGWGFTVKDHGFNQFNQNFLHWALVEFWYKDGGTIGRVEQFGGTKASYLSSSGKTIDDEDCLKKSVTDALVKAASYIGCCADIFIGQYEDGDYVEQLKEDFREKDETDVLCQQFVTNLSSVTTKQEFDTQAALIKTAAQEKKINQRQLDNILRPLCQKVLESIKQKEKK
jgi:hypothetical protein